MHLHLPVQVAKSDEKCHTLYFGFCLLEQQQHKDNICISLMKSVSNNNFRAYFCNCLYEVFGRRKIQNCGHIVHIARLGWVKKPFWVPPFFLHHIHSFSKLFNKGVPFRKLGPNSSSRQYNLSFEPSTTSVNFVSPIQYVNVAKE